MELTNLGNVSIRDKQIVREGYNKIASNYAAARTSHSEDVRLLNKLVERLPKGAMVLDAGCGCGYPVAEFLAKFFQVTAVDFAEEQIRLAKKKVPDARFVFADITNMPFNDSTFDAVCSYYAIIHVPRSEHRKLLIDFHRILRPAGLALLCMGAGDRPEDVAEYYGTQMFWSHYGTETNLRMVKENGFDILWFKTIEDPTSESASHLFVLGQKR